MSKFVIGFVDIDPDTGFKYPFVKICETEDEYMCNWISGTLKRDLMENADQPNREITFRIES